MICFVTFLGLKEVIVCVPAMRTDQESICTVLFYILMFNMNFVTPQFKDLREIHLYFRLLKFNMQFVWLKFLGLEENEYFWVNSRLLDVS